ncbi:hypothetical protein I316_03517 [Kwoniella heveanensis BCC8398]|uniref:Ornithine cyclodeaminase n=1 Tax=Kwoniella heveanensis BCC8398 TaxID=1296120 RepID=A0A1B9GV99_9TREE|nr:hypothetical protein I316_03517 [Kwoniella heveanensis BCC8398]
MSSSIRILTASHVDKVLSTLPPALALSSQAKVFRLYSAPSDVQPAPIQTPHRLTVSTEGSTMLFMPSRAPTDNDASSSAQTGSTTTAIKIVSVPTKGELGLPASTFIMDEASGSALFLSHFPTPTSPQNLILFGAGAQCVAHAVLFLRLHPTLTSVTFVVRSSNSRSQDAVSSLAKKFPMIHVTEAVHPSADSPGLPEVVGSADVIVAATSSTVPLFKSTPSVPKAGARVILIGSYKPTMHEVDTPLIQRSGVVVDSREACAVEAGELIGAGMEGRDLVELGEVLGGHGAVARGKVESKAGGKEGVIVFKSVGLGIQDVAIAKLVLDEAERQNLGTIVDEYD